MVSSCRRRACSDSAVRAQVAVRLHPGTPWKLDTRTRIVSYEQALEAASAANTAVVTGYFDPVTSEHARRLRDIRAESKCEQLIVFVTEPADPVLSARARCEILAAMGAVDTVAAAPLIPGLPNAYHEEEADQSRLERLIHRVHARA